MWFKRAVNCTAPGRVGNVGDTVIVPPAVVQPSGPAQSSILMVPVYGSFVTPAFLCTSDFSSLVHLEDIEVQT